MRFSENRVIAFIVLAACVLGSVFGLGGMGLAKERGKVLKVYDRGEYPDEDVRNSVDEHLDRAAEYAKDALNEAARFIGQSDKLDEGMAYATQLADSTSLDARAEALDKLNTLLNDTVFNAVLKAANIPAGSNDYSAIKDFKSAFDKFNERVRMVRYDGYSKLATSYNSLISGFPGSLVANVTGQGKLNTFGG